MKKYILILIICLFITGCGLTDNFLPAKVENKTLTCTKELNSSGIPMFQTAIINFADDKIEGINTNILVSLSDTYKKSIDTFVKSFEESYKKQYGDNKHVTVVVSKKSDSEILIDITLDYKNMNDEEKKSSGFSGSEKYDINKTQLEKSGYTCQ